MKKYAIGAALLLLFLSSSSYAQLTGAGIQPKLHFSIHVLEDPDLEPKFARSSTEILHSYGVDAYADYGIGRLIKLRAKIGYESKGAAGWFDHYNHVHYSKSQFNYVSTDLQARVLLRPDKLFRPSISFGTTVGYLVGRDVQETTSFHTTTFYNDYSPWNFGLTGAIGFEYDNVFFCEVEVNRDILRPVRSTELNIYNSVVGFNVGVNVLEIVRRTKAKS